MAGLSASKGLSVGNRLTASEGLSIGDGLSFQGLEPVSEDGILLENDVFFLMLEDDIFYLLQEV